MSLTAQEKRANEMPPALIRDPETKLPIATHSSLKTFRRCAKQAEFKFVQRLKPKMETRPLKLGTWMHKLLEVHYDGGDWELEHRKLSVKFNKLFEEEKDVYGDLPTDCHRLMRGYLWHYQHDHWKVHETELKLDTTFPDGSIYRCKLDVLFEDQFGLWIGDHKNFKSFPDHTDRLLDGQSALYVWCALRNKIPVQGFVWNYIRTKAPNRPKMTAKTGKVSIRKVDSEYLTYREALLDIREKFGPRAITPPVKHELARLKSLQFRPGEPQKSPFFHRHVLERSPEMLKTVASENYHTARRMHSYFVPGSPGSKHPERMIDRSCRYSCSYTELCALEMWGAPNVETFKKQRFNVGDPLEYYEDKVDERWREE